MSAVMVIWLWLFGGYAGDPQPIKIEFDAYEDCVSATKEVKALNGNGVQTLAICIKKSRQAHP